MMKKFQIPTENAEHEMTLLESEGKTAIMVSVDNKVEGIIAVADSLKDSSPTAIAALKNTWNRMHHDNWG